ncbi:MAG TPA: hypothetical protein VFC94_04680 [Bacteroidaceae bacterium]|nr:hypothetical protein [Bacteroidaceae bacterium]
MEKEKEILNEQEDDLLSNTPNNYSYNKLYNSSADEPEKHYTIWTKIKPWIYLALSIISIILLIKITIVIAERLSGIR